MIVMMNSIININFFICREECLCAVIDTEDIVDKCILLEDKSNNSLFASLFPNAKETE